MRQGHQWVGREERERVSQERERADGYWLERLSQLNAEISAEISKRYIEQRQRVNMR